MFDVVAEAFGFFHRVGLAVDADDGLGVALSQVYPAVGEVDFDAVDGGHLLALVVLLDGLEDGVNVHFRLEFELGLGNAVLRIGGLQLADTPTRASRP